MLKLRLLKFKYSHFFKQYVYKTKNVMSKVCLHVCIIYILVIKNVRILFRNSYSLLVFRQKYLMKYF